MSVTVINGSLFDTAAHYLCHQVNCQGKMGTGIAWQIRQRYPQAYKAYREWCRHRENLLGQAQFVLCPNGKVIVNMFAQNHYGYNGQRYTDYTAFTACLHAVQNSVPIGEAIAMPYKIGCGLGGGDWELIYTLLEKTIGKTHRLELWQL